MSRLLAIDHGEKRTGLAISDELAISTRPLPAIRTSDCHTLIDSILSIIDEYDISLIVIGWPSDSRGQTGHQARKVQAFIDELSLATNVDIEIFDESYSSEQAKQLLNVDHKMIKDKGLIDSKAAQIILSSYLNK